MGTKVGKKTLMTCVAVIIAVLVAAFFLSSGDEEPKAEAKPVGPPVHVYPEIGSAAGVAVEKGQATCTDFDGVKTTEILLPDSGGTVSYNGTHLSTDYTNEVVVVTIDGPSHFVSGWVTGSNEVDMPFNIPSKATGESSPGLRLESDDFKAMVGSIADVTLCSMG